MLSTCVSAFNFTVSVPINVIIFTFILYSAHCCYLVGHAMCSTSSIFDKHCVLRHGMSRSLPRALKTPNYHKSFDFLINIFICQNDAIR